MERPEKMEQQDRKDLKVLKETQVAQDRKDLQVLKAQRVIQDLKDLRVQQVLKVVRVVQDQQDHKVLKDLQEVMVVVRFSLTVKKQLLKAKTLLPKEKHNTYGLLLQMELQLVSYYKIVNFDR